MNKEGYTTKIYAITSSLDGWYFGNIIFGGVLGMLIVDPMTGAMYNLPARVDISLEQSVAGVEPDATLTIATIDSLTAAQKLRLVLIQE